MEFTKTNNGFVKYDENGRVIRETTIKVYYALVLFKSYSPFFLSNTPLISVLVLFFILLDFSYFSSL